MIAGHGNNLYEYDGLVLHDFSSNVAFNSKSREIQDFLKSTITSITNYPDPNATKLKQKIAEHHGIDPQCVLVTNGSAEAFYLLAHFLQRTKTLICYPAFAEYEDACLLYRHVCDFIPIDKFCDAHIAPYKSVWLCSPNNPDGFLTKPEIILRQCEKSPRTYFILDNAYSDLTTQKQEHEIVESPFNLITIKSLTKTFAIPGIRLGYIIANPQVISTLSAMRPPWSVNSLAIEAGIYILDNYIKLLPDLKELAKESVFLQAELAKFEKIEITSSTTNFFLSRLKKGTAKSFKEKLIHHYDILIRDASNFRGLDEASFRLSAQSHVQNKYLIHAINDLLNEF